MHYSLDNLTPAFYSKSLKTSYQRHSHPSDFAIFLYLPFGRTRTENILNIGQSNLITAFSESATSQICVVLLRKLSRMTNISKYTQYGKGDGFALNISKDENFNQYLICNWNEPARSFNNSDVVIIELNNDLSPVPYNKDINPDDIIGYVVKETAKIPNTPFRYKETIIGNEKHGHLIREFM